MLDVRAIASYNVRLDYLGQLVYPAFQVGPSTIHNPSSFPVDALGPVMADAVIEHHCHTGAPIASIATSVLASAHACVQDLCDVQPPNRNPIPCSGIYTIVAGATEDLVDSSIGLLPIRRHEQLSFENQKIAAARYAVEDDAWKAAERAVLRRMRKAAEQDMAHLLEGAKKELTALRATRPEKPRAARIVETNTNPRAWQKSLDAGSQSILLLNLSADDEFKGLLKRLNAFAHGRAEGRPLPLAAHADRLHLPDYRVSGLFGVRYASFIGNLDRWTRDSACLGALASMLLTEPEPIPPTYPSRFNAAHIPFAVTRYQNRLSELLDEGDHRRAIGRPRDIALLSTSAAAHYALFHDYLRGHSLPGGALTRTTAMHSYAERQTASMACVIHKVEGWPGDIDRSSLDRSIELVRWYVNRNVMFIAQDRPSLQLEADAATIAEAFRNSVGYRISSVSRKELKSWCPPEMSQARFHNALQLLIARGMVKPEPTARGIYLKDTPLLWPPLARTILDRLDT